MFNLYTSSRPEKAIDNICGPRPTEILLELPVFVFEFKLSPAANRIRYCAAVASHILDMFALLDSLTHTVVVEEINPSIH